MFENTFISQKNHAQNENHFIFQSLGGIQEVCKTFGLF